MPTPTAADSVRVRAATMVAFIAEVLATCGLRDPDAERVGTLMVEADLVGAGGHGIFRLP